MKRVNSDGEFRRRMIMAIPVVWILIVAVLRWTGAIGRPEARAAAPQPAAAPTTANNQTDWQKNWPAGPMRNLFLTRLDQFPRDIGTAQQPMRPGDSAGDAKSPAFPADQNHDASSSGMAAQVSRIHLQSTMMRPIPRALVNGQIVSEGDFVGDFRVVRITLSQIVLEKQGLEFTVTLK